MTTYNTGNPIGSTAVKDLYDNAENLDTLVNDRTQESHPDRLGQQRKTWHGMEAEFDGDQARRESEFVDAQADKQQRFNLLLANSGYEHLADYAAGIEVTEYNQLIRDTAGQLWRASAATTLPYTTDGTGLPEGGAFVAVGDADIRNDLAAGVGAGKGGLLVRGSVIHVDNLTDLYALPTSEMFNGQTVIVSNDYTYKYLNGAFIPTYQTSIVAGQRNLFDRLVGSTAIKGGYTYRIESGSFYCGFNVNTKVAQWRFFLDSDGIITARGAQYGDAEKTPFGFSATQLVGSFIRSSTNDSGSYARVTGDKFRLDFEGTNLTFRHNADSRGGIWRFVIDEDENNPVEITTNSDVLGQSGVVEQEIFTDLQDVYHKVEATYQGADPNSTESEHRGWMIYRTGGRGDTGQVFGKMPDHIGGNRDGLLPTNSVFDFAINAKATASPDPGHWVPKHGGGGSGNAARNIVRDIVINGESIGSDITAISTRVQAIDSIVIRQNYTAYSTYDINGDYPMWDGFLVHKLEKGVLTTTHRIEVLQEIKSNAGYMAMLPSSSSFVDSFKTDSETVFSLSATAGDREAKYPKSIAFFDDLKNAAVAMEVSSISEAMGLYYKIPTKEAFLQERTDGIAKFYWPIFDGDTIQAGEVFTCQSRVALSCDIDTHLL